MREKEIDIFLRFAEANCGENESYKVLMEGFGKDLFINLCESVYGIVGNIKSDDSDIMWKAIPYETFDCIMKPIIVPLIETIERCTETIQKMNEVSSQVVVYEKKDGELHDN